MEINELKYNIAQNIYYLRTVNHMTQSELGEKLNYSDKAISKWERAEGMPDAYVLHKISDMFGVSVDYLINEHNEQDTKIETKPTKDIKRLIATIVLWGIIAVAILLMVVLYLATDNFYWQIIIYSLPVTFIVQIVLSCVWWRGRGSFLFASLLIWAILGIVYVALLRYNFWEIFFIGIPVQIIVFLCYKIRITITVTQKNPKFFVWKDSGGKKPSNNGENGENKGEK
ncbi:MAG: helix-turn-helix domain-containing protein [Ruminococcaceae bacterium]|nr:helix-turn-helix domain-containing protein [Oscillospiraceae bacterium]